MYLRWTYISLHKETMVESDSFNHEILASDMVKNTCSFPIDDIGRLFGYKINI